MTFQTTDVKQRRSLKFHDRGRRQTPPAVRRNANLLPREIFAGHKNALNAYDELLALLESSRTHSIEARRCNAEADAAAETYRTKVREALARGKNADKIKDNTTALKIQAEEHAKLAKRAEALADSAGTRLGEAIQDVAPQTFDKLDDTIDTAAQQVREAQAQLDQAVQQWAGHWHARRILSDAWLFGGMVGNYDPTGVRPKELAAANVAISELLGSLDDLKADEAQILAQREKDEAAERSNARAFGTHAAYNPTV